MNAVTRLLDRVRGSGEAAVSVPPMDGPLKPNELLDAGVTLLEVEQPDNVVGTAGGLLFTSGARLMLLERGATHRSSAPVVLAEYSALVSAIAVSQDGAMAVGLASGAVEIRGGPYDGRRITAIDGRPLNCPTSLAFETPRRLLITNGSARYDPLKWKHDLMEGGRTGFVCRIDLDTGTADMLAVDLAYPYGLLPQAGGQVAVSESWRHRVLLVGGDGPQRVLLPNLPGYPGRMCSDGGEGCWLAVFAPRRRLIELVLREPAYRRRMMQEIDSDYWVAPTLAPMSSFLEPLQGGTLKTLARLKPWAPSRSYGLVLRLDRDWRSIASLHSRADGIRHGIRSIAWSDDMLIAASAGAGEIFQVRPA